jgi:tRNA U34 5-methylaminomethyl-2-thiouridine-forming methyltransferase MnmC
VYELLYKFGTLPSLRYHKGLFEKKTIKLMDGKSSLDVVCGDMKKKWIRYENESEKKICEAIKKAWGKWVDIYR